MQRVGGPPSTGGSPDEIPFSFDLPKGGQASFSIAATDVTPAGQQGIYTFDAKARAVGKEIDPNLSNNNPKRTIIFVPAP